MPLLNYTTSIDAAKTIGEIQAMLARAKASAILTEYDGFGNVSTLTFRLGTPMGQMGFRLPANIDAVLAVINRQCVAGLIPKRFKGDRAQAARVAWRIIKDWVEAQLAIVETQMVTIEQVFLPYATSPTTGQTVYESLCAQKFNGLALPEKGIGG